MANEEPPESHYWLMITFWFALFVFSVLVFCYALTGCGYSEPEMQMARDRQMQMERELEECWDRLPARPEDLDGGADVH